jgi:aliphatic nitrilase
VIGADGSILGKHRKLVPTWGERVVWAGGDGSTMGVFPTPWGALGTLCCGENINPLARYALLAQGERIHVANFPSACMAGARHSANELYLHVAPHAYEGKLYSLVSSDFGSAAIAAKLGLEFSVPAGGYNCISGIMGPSGEWVSPPLVDTKGIVYADCPLEPVVQAKLFHDVIGHYNRFDVLRFELNTKPLAAIKMT